MVYKTEKNNNYILRIYRNSLVVHRIPSPPGTLCYLIFFNDNLLKGDEGRSNELKYT